MIPARIARVRSPVIAGVAIAAIGAVTYFALRSLTRREGSLPPGVVPPRQKAAPFAKISGSPVWPVITSDGRVGQVAYTDQFGKTHGNAARQFGASRDGRRHVGVDLYANAGDLVLAIEDGIVISVQTFHLGSWAILVQHDDAVVLYGEVEKGSWTSLGVSVGSRVRRGQPIAKVACMRWDGSRCDSHMLHLETYRSGTVQNKKWYGSTPPSEILDPTQLLLIASPAGAN